MTDGIETTETETNDGDEVTDNEQLTSKTGLVWAWLPTLVAASYLGTLLLLVVAQAAADGMVSLERLPPTWKWTFLVIAGGSAMTTIGADALSSWYDLRSR